MPDNWRCNAATWGSDETARGFPRQLRRGPRHRTGPAGERRGVVPGAVPAAAAGDRLRAGLRPRRVAYWQALADADTLAAMRMTLTVAAISVPLNTAFGIPAAWAISKF